jgi:thioredoxin reductase (NADPH)
VPGIDQLTGAGVYYGTAMTEAFSCKDEEVTIIGGANSAGQAALHLARYACNVTMVVRGDSLAKGMSQYLVDQIEATEKIKVRLKSKVTAVEGKRKLESVTITSTETCKQETIASSALFILIGAMPNTDWLAGIVERDENGFILSGLDMLSNKRIFKNWRLDREPFMLETSVPGIFVAGDVHHRSIKRVASAVGQGSIAIQMIHQYLSKL